MEERWPRCEVGPGMFSDELTVRIRTGNDEDARSAFESKDAVDANPGAREGRVRVRAFWSGSSWWAVLPSEDQEALPVGAADLSAG